MIEKPLAFKVEKGAKSQRARVTPMMVGDVERFNPAVNGIKQVVRTRKLWLAIALVGRPPRMSVW